MSLRKNLQSICTDGITFSLMVGFGETYIPAFAMALGMSEVLTGLIATLPIFGGSVLQMISPWGVNRLRSYRYWVLGAVAVQVASLLALSWIAFVGGAPAWLVFGAATFYWAGGLATSAAWNTWVEFLVPTRIRPTFFARRVRMSQVSLLAALVLAGLGLRYAQLHQVSLPAFSLLFLAAALCRTVSWWALSRQSEERDWVGHDVLRPAHATSACQPLPEGSQPESTQPGPAQGAAPWVEAPSGTKVPLSTEEGRLRRFVVYLCCVQVAVYVSGPYFTPYMLKHLSLSYMAYMVLLALGFAGKVIALPFVGAAARRWGASVVFRIGGLGIVPVAGLWAVSNSFYFLMAVQVLSGICWAFYELAMLLLFLERIPRERRVLVLSYYNVGNSLAMVIGACVGAALMAGVGGGVTGYYTVFLVSSLSRAATALLMPVWPAVAATPNDGRLPSRLAPAATDNAPETLVLKPSTQPPLADTIHRSNHRRDDVVVTKPVTA